MFHRLQRRRKSEVVASEKEARFRYEQEECKRAFLQTNRPCLEFVPSASASTDPTMQRVATGGTMVCEICKMASKLNRLPKKVCSWRALRFIWSPLKLTRPQNHVKATTIVAAKSQPEKTPTYKMICSLNKHTLEKLSS